ncbi:MAG: hypothetical protein DRQ88_09270 [Epsilonproteobacteria bacterium]|nr:MAG: hypothetical protein DRQ88_09270 [Campylobacterota bacterium]
MNIPGYIYKPESSVKAKKLGRSLGYLNGISYHEPGPKICTPKFKLCINDCYYNSGQLGMPVQKKALQERSGLFKNDFSTWLMMLEIDIRKHIRQAEKLGLKPSFRLNGTSDIKTQDLGIIEKYKEVQFYDYTKDFYEYSIHKNYYLIYSYDGTNWGDCLKKLRDGFNVAIVFDKIPETFKGFAVSDGDNHDLRFLDRPGQVIGLKPKGKLRKNKGIKWE